MSALIDQLEVLRLTLLYLTVADVLCTIERRIFPDKRDRVPDVLWYWLWPVMLLLYLPSLGEFCVDQMNSFLWSLNWWIDDLGWKLDDWFSGVSLTDCDCMAVGMRQCSYHGKRSRLRFLSRLMG